MPSLSTWSPIFPEKMGNLPLQDPPPRPDSTVAKFLARKNWRSELKSVLHTAMEVIECNFIVIASAATAGSPDQRKQITVGFFLNHTSPFMEF